MMKEKNKINQDSSDLVYKFINNELTNWGR